MQLLKPIKKEKRGSGPISRILFCHKRAASAIYLRRTSPSGSSVLPSIVQKLGQATLRRWFTRTCSLQQTQLAGRPVNWWSLAPPSHPYPHGIAPDKGRLFSSAYTCCRQQLPFSEVECLVLSGLSSCISRCQRQTRPLPFSLSTLQR